LIIPVSGVENRLMDAVCGVSNDLQVLSWHLDSGGDANWGGEWWGEQVWWQLTRGLFCVGQCNHCAV